MWLGLGYGKNMENVDMVLFQGKGDSGEISDLWSMTETMPTKDSSNDYIHQKNQKNNGMYTFTTYRKLDTGDAKDTVIKCGEDYKMAWTVNSMTAEFAQHNRGDLFTLTTKADCTVVLSSAVYKIMGILTAGSALLFA